MAEKGDFIGFTYNGVHSSDLGLVRTSSSNRYSDDLLPVIQDKTVQVPGGDGTYFFGSYYTQLPISIEYAFDNISETQFRKLRRLFGDKRNHELIFDEMPFKHYWCKPAGTQSMKYLCFDIEDTEETEVEAPAYHEEDVYAFKPNVTYYVRIEAEANSTFCVVNNMVDNGSGGLYYTVEDFDSSIYDSIVSITAHSYSTSKDYTFNKIEDNFWCTNENPADGGMKLTYNNGNFSFSIPSMNNDDVKDEFRAKADTFGTLMFLYKDEEDSYVVADEYADDITYYTKNEDGTYSQTADFLVSTKIVSDFDGEMSDIPLYQPKITSAGRVYKGEGSVSLVAYKPFAYCPSDQKTSEYYRGYDNMSEWIDASRIKSAKNGFDTFISNSGGGYFKVWNAGDLATDFKVTLHAEGTINLTAFTLEYLEDSNLISQVTFKGDIPLKGDDKYIQYNTQTNLIDGLDENKEKTGNIYNEYIKQGHFFKLPTMEDGDKIGLTITGDGFDEAAIEYDYLYF